MPNPNGQKRSNKIIKKEKAVPNVQIGRLIKVLDGNISKASQLTHNEMQEYIKELSRIKLKQLHPDTRVKGIDKQPGRKYQRVLKAKENLLNISRWSWRHWCSFYKTEPILELPFAYSWDIEVKLGDGWQLIPRLE